MPSATARMWSLDVDAPRDRQPHQLERRAVVLARSSRRAPSRRCRAPWPGRPSRGRSRRRAAAPGTRPGRRAAGSASRRRRPRGSRWGRRPARRRPRAAPASQRRLLDAGADVAVVEHLLDAARHRREVGRGEAAVVDAALVDPQLLLGEARPLGVVLEGEEAADVDEEVLLAGDRAAVAVEPSSRAGCRGSACAV